jgi:hypothetical protein
MSGEEESGEDRGERQAGQRWIRQIATGRDATLSVVKSSPAAWVSSRQAPRMTHEFGFSVGGRRATSHHIPGAVIGVVRQVMTFRPAVGVRPFGGPS